MYPNQSDYLIEDEQQETGCESNILILIMKIQPIFLLLFGFVANLVSFVVLIQERLRRRPTFAYLAYLSLSNAFLSLIHAFFTLSGVYFGRTLENLSLILFCRIINRFLIDFLSHFSLCTLTAVDLERVRSVTSRKTNYQRDTSAQSSRNHGLSKAFRQVSLIEFIFAIILIVFNLHWLTSYGYVESEIYSNESMSLKTMCTFAGMEGYSKFYALYLSLILPIIELIFFNILPFLISIIATIIILRYVSIKYASIKRANQQLKQSRRRLELHLSILLISLNCVYIFCVTPHNIFNIYVTHLQRQLANKHGSEAELCSVAFTQKSLDLLQQCYFMSTFFLYILTNRRFREEFYRLFKCCILFNIYSPRHSTKHIRVQSKAYRRSAQQDNDFTKQNRLAATAPELFGSRTSIMDGLNDD